MKPILIVHPNDNSTKFLDRVKRHLITSFPNDTHHFNIQPTDSSHFECLDRIASHPESGIIIFLGHGRTDQLLGSKGKLYDSIDFVSSEALSEHPESFYHNESFINESNVDVFKGKKVFCLACNSNSSIARFAIEKGTKVFLGFGDIPTSIHEFQSKEVKASKSLVVSMKTELNYIIKTAIVYSVQNNSTFEQMLHILHFITNQRIAYLLAKRKDLSYRYVLANALYCFKMTYKY